MYRWSLCALLFVACVDVSFQKKTKPLQVSPSRGWGDDITWVETYEDGLKKMKKSNKPLMVILHLDECQFSQALKAVFVADKEIQKMAQEDFIMVNLTQETNDPNLGPDGFYVPRILFVDPSMTVRADLTGKYSNRLYTYEPSDMQELMGNMRKAKVLMHSEL